MKKWIGLAIVLAALVGCQADYKNSKVREELEQTQKEEVPILICEKDGVRLWKVRDNTPGGPGYVYFTAPSGDVSWTIPGGKNQSEQPMQVGGVKKR